MKKQISLQEKLFAQVLALLAERGLILKKGAIVDSTIIAAPSSTKNREKNSGSPFRRLPQGKAEAEIDSGCRISPQATWLDEKELAERFICEVVLPIRVHEIFCDA